MIGGTLGSYRIVEQIGMGGMATVYKAYDPAMDRYVAIKVLPAHYAQDPKFIKRFEREAKAIARLEHPHILPVHTYGTENGTTYLVMRYLSTGTLKERIAQGPLSLEEAGLILEQIAAALDYAHEHGILHRDAKPSNVLLDEKGNAYLTDFGIAKMVEATVELTGGGLLGTPAYMSPEQCQGSKDLTPASDQYALGIVLYEMLTGQTPFQAETPIALIHMQLHDPLPPPRSINPNLTEDVERVILKALAREPENRFPSCSAMADALRRAAAKPEPAEYDVSTRLPMVTSPDAVTYDVMRPAPRARRLPVWVWGAVGVVALAGLIGGALALGVFEPGGAESTPVAGVPPRGQPTPTPAEPVTEGAESPTASHPVPEPSPTAYVSPYAAQARVFAEPILNAIADREPDFSEDFENELSGWQVGPQSDLDNTVSGHTAYIDGEYATIADVPDPSAPSDQNQLCSHADYGGILPDPVDFVLAFDVRIEALQRGGWSVHLRSWREPGDEVETRTYDLGFFEGRNLHLARKDHDQDTWLAEFRGEPLAGISETNHIIVIARGQQMAVYANGEPVLYVEDEEYIESSWGEFHFNACNHGGEPLDVRWDNIRIWILADQ